jgi:hypothetical protein
MNNEMRKKIKFSKEPKKKSWSQLVLIFETYDPGHEAGTDLIKEKP